MSAHLISIFIFFMIAIFNHVQKYGLKIIIKKIIDNMS